MRDQSSKAQRALGETMGALAYEYFQTDEPERKKAVKARLQALTREHGCNCSGVRHELKSMWRGVQLGDFKQVAMSARSAGWLAFRK